MLSMYVLARALESSVVSVLGSVMFVSLFVLPKAFEPMYVTLSGSTIDVSWSAFQNASVATRSTILSIHAAESGVYAMGPSCLCSLLPMDVRPFGSWIDSKLQFCRSLLGMDVKEPGTIAWV